MNRDEALAIVREYVKNENLVRHMLAVEAAMRFYAEKFGEDAKIMGRGRSAARFRLGDPPHAGRASPGRRADPAGARRAGGDHPAPS